MSKIIAANYFPFLFTAAAKKNFQLDQKHFKSEQFSKMHKRALWLFCLTCLIIKSAYLPTIVNSCCFLINPSLLISSCNERVQAFKTAKICMTDLKANKKHLGSTKTLPKTENKITMAKKVTKQKKENSYLRLK